VDNVSVGVSCSLLEDGGCIVDSVGPAVGEAERVKANRHACQSAQVREASESTTPRGQPVWQVGPSLFLDRLG
jgi:hypothetical protein